MTPRRKLLIVDDDRNHRTMLRTLLTSWGYGVEEAGDGRDAIARVRLGPFDLVLMDIRMLEVSGIEALGEIKAFNPAIPVVLMTAYASVETAVEALKKGALDYIVKPLDFEKLRRLLGQSLAADRLQGTDSHLVERTVVEWDRRHLIARSPVMLQLLETVTQVASSEATVLLTGESGTGKELIAGAIHAQSFRKEGPFVKINCAAITETLLESELFGHEKGAFTGADRRKEGKFRQAHGGTLFLDEIGEMPLMMQVKMLRVLQEREVVRVGGEEVLPVDVRLIAATHRDLRADIAEGRFREDLYYRLHVVSLHIPALKERQEDIPLIAQHYLRLFAEKNRKNVRRFTPQAMDRLLRYPWPGNVRELMNVVERGVVLTRIDALGEEELSLVLEGSVPATEKQAAGNDGRSLEVLERDAILKTLEETDGNKSEAARRLGVTRRTLHQKLKRYGVF